MPYVGRTVADVIEEFQDDGYPFAYSTNLVSADLVVQKEPSPGTPLEVVSQILEPYGLVIRTDSGVHLVVRDSGAGRSSKNESVPTTEALRIADPLETVIVSASRYAISRDIAASKFSVDQRTIQNMPDVGEDPIRVTQRLPGAAASGASAMAHFSGGEAGEIGIMLNGQWLFDPFHIRDYQNIFSAIDARAIEMPDPSGNFVDDIVVVSYQQDGPFVPLQGNVERIDGFQVQVIGRLIEHQTIRFLQHQPTENQPCGLTARKSVRGL